MGYTVEKKKENARKSEKEGYTVNKKRQRIR
jgi:hypothetical protein